jgi:hypothetical protein
MKKQTFIAPGDRFNRLTAIRYSHTGKHHRRYFIFKCDYGNETTITAEAAISGNTKSCGCLAKEVKQAKRLPGNHGEITAIILGYKRHAERRGFKFALTRTEVEVIIKKDCHYCGSKPSNLKQTKNSIEGLLYNGIDRIDSQKDYYIKNVVPCCSKCNTGKSDMTTEKFLDWIKRVHVHSFK